MQTPSFTPKQPTTLDEMYSQFRTLRNTSKSEIDPKQLAETMRNISQAIGEQGNILAEIRKDPTKFDTLRKMEEFFTVDKIRELATKEDFNFEKLQTTIDNLNTKVLTLPQFQNVNKAFITMATEFGKLRQELGTTEGFNDTNLAKMEQFLKANGNLFKGRTNAGALLSVSTMGDITGKMQVGLLALRNQVNALAALETVNVSKERVNSLLTQISALTSKISVNASLMANMLGMAPIDKQEAIALARDIALVDSRAGWQGLATWVANTKTPIEKLNLEPAEVQELGKYLKYADLTGYTADEITFLLNNNFFPEVQHIKISDPHLETLPPLPNFVKILDISGCEALKELPAGLDIAELHCDGCQNLKSLDGLTNLKVLNAPNCGNLQTLPETMDELQTINIMFGRKIETLPARLPSVKSFNATTCEKISLLPEMPQVETALLDYMRLLSLINEDMPKLKFLSAQATGIKRIDGQFPELETLKVFGCINLTTFENAKVPKLKNLNMNLCSKCVFIPRDMPELTSFSGRNSNIVTFTGNYPKLADIDLEGSLRLKVITGPLPAARIIKANLCTTLEALPKVLPAVVTLSVNQSAIDEINGDMPELLKLECSSNAILRSVSVRAPKLQELHIDDDPRVVTVSRGMNDLQILTYVGSHNLALQAEYARFRNPS